MPCNHSSISRTFRALGDHRLLASPSVQPCEDFWCANGDPALGPTRVQSRPSGPGGSKSRSCVFFIDASNDGFSKINTKGKHQESDGEGGGERDNQKEGEGGGGGRRRIEEEHEEGRGVLRL